MIDDITPLIITYNEAPNIRRVLDRLDWARRIVVIDSGSTDGTLEILDQHPRVDVTYHPFREFASQCNFGLTRIRTPWVMSIDADYELSEELIDELRYLTPTDRIAGYRARFVYRIFGRSLHGTLYPPRTVLYRKERAAYRCEGHGHRVVIDGEVVELNGVIYHDDRKPLMRFIASQQNYAREESAYLAQTPNNELSTVDRIRRTAWLSPLLIVFYTLFVKGCILDGWAGLFYAFQRLIAETLIAIELIDRRIKHNKL